MQKKLAWIIWLLIIIIMPCPIFASEKKVTVYTYSSFPTPLIEKIQAHFQKELQAKVQFKSFSDTGPLFNQLLQEKKDPVADLVIGLDNNFLPQVVKNNLFLPYRPKAASQIKPELVFDAKYRMIPFDYGYVVFNYDREKLDTHTRGIPASHRDLLDPYYKGKIIIENPLTSSPGQVFLLTTIALYGENGYLDYWRALKKNLLAVTPGWDEAYGMYTSGEAPIVLSYGTSPVYHLLNDKTERYQPLVLDDAAYAQIEGMGIVKKPGDYALVKVLVEYILSPEFQELIPENQYMYPVRPDVSLPESFRIAAKVKRLLNLPPEKVAANLEKWQSAWEKVMN